MVFMIIAANFTHFEKSRKNTFLVNSKKWKKGERGLENETIQKWHLLTAIILWIQTRMQKFRKILREVFENRLVSQEFW